MGRRNYPTVMVTNAGAQKYNSTAVNEHSDVNMMRGSEYRARRISHCPEQNT